MQKRTILKTSALIAAFTVAGLGATAADKTPSNSLFGFKSAQDTVADRAKSRENDVSQNTQTQTDKKKKKKKRKKKRTTIRRGSYE